MYGNGKACGHAIEDSGIDRFQIFFTTKIPPGSIGYERTRKAIDTSRKKRSRTTSILEAQKAGKTKSIGVSNYGVHNLDELEQYIKGGGGTIDVGQITEAVVKTIGKKYNKSPAQVLIRWSLQKGFVPLPKSATPNRIQENAEVFDFELSDADMKILHTGEYDPIDCDPTIDYD
ncbi:hypothetical protein EYZ11_004830 [Aspergillus tanneri]|uniref:D-xylose reductase [NAD(P)H] n=1 Tax=Aspergillus tanneri TaxID=1220188 RepID=A0A4S3JLX6_9EURO|nr:hypothetical protein EYZ11_004830 [Aspergillus tanneri]